MATESRADDSGDERQLRLDEFGAQARCQAISVTASRQCKHEALPGVPYCPDHYHLLKE